MFSEHAYTGGTSFGFEGTVIDGTYNPVENTVDIVLLETYADFAPGFPLRGTLVTPMVGFQGGPQGGERAIMIPTRAGWRVMLDQSFDDSPQTPIGEWRGWHAKMGTTGAGNTPVFDGGFHTTNDGATPGDGLGGTYSGNRGALTQAQTSGGYIHRLDDTAKKASTITPGGMSGVYDDNVKQIVHTAVAGAVLSIIDGINQKITHQAGTNTFQAIDAALEEITHQGAPGLYTLIAAYASGGISHVVPPGSMGIGLGDLFKNLDSGKAAINNDILTTFGSNVNDFGLANLINFTNLMHTAGVITGAQLSTMLAALVISFITKVGIPAGSATVRLKP